MLTTILMGWMLLTMASAVGLVAFLALDQWQVRRLKSTVQRPVQVTPAEVAQVA